MFSMETARLLLKPHSLDNLELMHAWETDPELLYYNDSHPEESRAQTLEDTRRFLEKAKEQRPNATLHYGIHKKEDGQLIGYGMMAFLDEYNRSCKIGITIGAREEWGRGFAVETLRGVLDYCFNTRGLHRVGGEAFSFNQRSIRMFARLGFRREGSARESVMRGGKYYDEIYYGLLEDEYRALQS